MSPFGGRHLADGEVSGRDLRGHILQSRLALVVLAVSCRLGHPPLYRRFVLGSLAHRSMRSLRIAVLARATCVNEPPALLAKLLPT
jgi:hypothetical protein